MSNGTLNTQGATPRQFQEIRVLQLASIMLKRWKSVFAFPFITALAVALISLIISPRYTSTATFLPEDDSRSGLLPSSLVGLASQFGVRVPTGGTPPELYAAVLVSRTLMDSVLQSSFPDPRAPGGTNRASLLDILEIEGDSLAERLEEGREELEDIASLKIDDASGLISVSIETRYPALSGEVANRYVALLNDFNLATRQTTARARRSFIEDRLPKAEEELRTSEDDLQRFQERNRDFRSSPQLQLEFERLQRRLDIKQEVLLTLRREHEEARIEEVKNTPVITIIDAAVPAKQKSSPKRTLLVLLALLASGALGIAIALTQEAVILVGERDHGELSQLRTQWSQLRQVFKPTRPSHGS